MATNFNVFTRLHLNARHNLPCTLCVSGSSLAGIYALACRGHREACGGARGIHSVLDIQSQVGGGIGASVQSHRQGMGLCALVHTQPLL